MSKVSYPFILTDTRTLTFPKALPEAVLTALRHMPGHIRSTVQANNTICTFNKLYYIRSTVQANKPYYHEDLFRDAVESVIAKAVEGEKK